MSETKTGRTYEQVLGSLNKGINTQGRITESRK
jgi:hypothetical protein